MEVKPVKQDSEMNQDERRRVVFVVESPFSLRDEERFGVAHFLEAGFVVEAWEIAPITLPRSEYQWFESARHAQITRFTDLAEFADASRALSEVDVLIALVSMTGERLFPPRRLMTALCATPAVLGTVVHAITFDASLGETRVESLPILSRLKHRLKISSRIGMYSLYSIPSLGHVCRRTIRRLLRIRPLDFAWVAADRHGLHPLLASDGCQLRVIHSLDFERALQGSAQVGSKESYALLVDGMGPLHPDHVTLGIDPKLRPEEFFALVNKALDQFSEVSSDGVQIAAHPRAEPGTMELWYPNRRVRYSETVDAIAEARHVIFYYPSTIMALAVKMRKQIVMIRSDVPGFHDEVCDALIERLHLSVITVDDNVASAHFRPLDEQAYAEFERLHTVDGESDERSFWQLVLHDLDKT